MHAQSVDVQDAIVLLQGDSALIAAARSGKSRRLMMQTVKHLLEVAKADASLFNNKVSKCGHKSA